MKKNTSNLFILLLLVVIVKLVHYNSSLNSNNESLKNLVLRSEDSFKRCTKGLPFNQEANKSDPGMMLDKAEELSKGHLDNTYGVAFEDRLKGPQALPDDDPQLIQHIKKMLLPPSEKPYNTKKIATSRGQAAEIINILGEMENEGFYIDCGAYDGVYISNSLEFERKYGWNGLLVEGDPKMFARLVDKQRKAWSINACLSLNPYPNQVMFLTKGVYGKITAKAPSESSSKYSLVQCLPLYSLLMALNTTTVDYFSLDVEGSELDVLKTIPWDKVNIRTLSVEFVNVKAGKDALRQYMEDNGYNFYKEAGNRLVGDKSDFIFYRKDVVPMIPASPI